MDMKSVKYVKWLIIPLGYFLLFSAFKAQSAERTFEQSGELPAEKRPNKSTQPNLKQLLLMPGKLTQSHAHLENQCSNCHVHFDTSQQAPLCLDCHKTIKQDVEDKTGYHGRLPQDELNRCSTCHSDHLGREADIMRFDSDNFDHDQTDFKLEGKHAQQSCQSCHDNTHPKSKKPTFLIPEASCNNCHQDPHEQRLSSECTDCHNQQGWQVKTFDHEQTDFPLKDKHQKVACKSCHVKDVSAPLATQCSSCHGALDSHFGVFGEKCESCHSEKGWQDAPYDHFKQSKYKLEGKHARLECANCHFEALNPKKTCIDCHSKNDIHLGGNGNECQQCHNNEQWQKATFDHDKETDFNLLGAHQELLCTACHLPGETAGKGQPPRQCIDCHKDSDPHQNQLGDSCSNCHQQNSWDEQVVFNHDFTQFPLTGSHGLLACQSCHEDKAFQIKTYACIDCHKTDDFHQQTLGTQCADCHNVSSWQAWQFDHQSQTDYPLTGAHRDLSCELCHKPVLPQPQKPPTNCVGCHKVDDVHQGRFGNNCGQCHNKERFYDVQN